LAVENVMRKTAALVAALRSLNVDGSDSITAAHTSPSRGNAASGSPDVALSPAGD